MKNCLINTPLGVAKICGDESGISSVSVLNTNETITDIIPEILQDCVFQLQEYFNGEREDFNLKILNFRIFFIWNFGLCCFIKFKISLLLYLLFLTSIEQTTDVLVFDIGRNAIGPDSVNI